MVTLWGYCPGWRTKTRARAGGLIPPRYVGGRRKQLAHRYRVMACVNHEDEPATQWVDVSDICQWVDPYRGEACLFFRRRDGAPVVMGGSLATSIVRGRYRLELRQD